MDADSTLSAEATASSGASAATRPDGMPAGRPFARGQSGNPKGRPPAPADGPRSADGMDHVPFKSSRSYSTIPMPSCRVLEAKAHNRLRPCPSRRNHAASKVDASGWPTGGRQAVVKKARPIGRLPTSKPLRARTAQPSSLNSPECPASPTRLARRPKQRASRPCASLIVLSAGARAHLLSQFRTLDGKLFVSAAGHRPSGFGRSRGARS